MEEKFHFVKRVGFRKVTFNFLEINWFVIPDWLTLFEMESNFRMRCEFRKHQLRINEENKFLFFFCQFLTNDSLIMNVYTDLLNTNLYKMYD